MPPPRATLDPKDIYAALDKYAGNKTAMAAELGINRCTLRTVMKRYGISDKPVAGGALKRQPPIKMELPRKGQIKRYLLSCMQNNTKAHGAFVHSLRAYKKWLSDTEIMVARVAYNKSAYENALLSKPGRGPTDSDREGLWYDRTLSDVVCDDPSRHGSCRYELAPGLHWCAEVNVIPTDSNPLSDLDTQAGLNSAIFPHTKQEMRSRPRMPDEDPLFIYTTGACTRLNYIQRKAGQKAEFHHIYGALLVEVNHKGQWWARQINAESDGTFYDCPGGSIVRVKHGEVTEGWDALALNWGDIHASEIDEEVRRVNWGKGGAIDMLRPKIQFFNDLHSQRSQNHHDKSLSTRYKKWWLKQDVVKDEVELTRKFLFDSHRSWCKSVIVRSNHDAHGDRWLNDANFKEDLPNAKFFCQAQAARLQAIEDGDEHWTFLQWSLGQGKCPPVRFLRKNESFYIGPKARRIQCSLHGHLGPNGARGSTANISRVGSGKANKGHSHVAEIIHGTQSAGTCQLRFDYQEGPSSHSVSHILTYRNAKRCMLTQRAGQLWA